ncbi:MAG: hypothetical protein ACOCTG_00495 [Bacteroidota bacterium]
MKSASFLASVALVAVTAASFVIISGCDTSISGTQLDNQPPSTQLSVRDTSLVGNIEERDRFASTVFVSWTGTDPDGFVTSFDLRYFNEGERPGPEDEWNSTTRNDTLILLPIPRGEAVANVVFEVRAVDNEGARDPRPARTVFPIRNSPPTLRLNTFDLPPDTTFTVFSFSWTADDPEGAETLSRIEISLNDTTNFVAVPPDISFITLVGEFDRNDPSETVSEAAVYAGRSFQSTDIRVPGLRLDADNVLYARAVDQTDTTSVRQQYAWYVRKPKGRVLYVNDYRKSTWPTIQAFHLELLREYMPASEQIDVWDLSKPYVSGSTGNTPRSDAFPSSVDPTLRQTWALYDYIYWVSTNTVNSVGGNNLPFGAGVMDLFFERGGKMMVHSPMTQPENPEDNLGNPAVLLLPISDPFVRPDSLQRLELPTNSPLTPVQPLPGIGQPLPELKMRAFLFSELPFYADGANIVPLYEGAYNYLTRRSVRGTWTSPRFVASISADRRVGLFALPLINEQTGAPVIVGADDDPETARTAVKLMLESLEFPKR